MNLLQTNRKKTSSLRFAKRGREGKSNLDDMSKKILETNVDLKVKGAEKLYDKATENEKR